MGEGPGRPLRVACGQGMGSAGLPPTRGAPALFGLTAVQGLAEACAMRILVLAVWVLGAALLLAPGTPCEAQGRCAGQWCSSQADCVYPCSCVARPGGVRKCL